MHGVAWARRFQQKGQEPSSSLTIIIIGNNNNNHCRPGNYLGYGILGLYGAGWFGRFPWFYGFGPVWFGFGAIWVGWAPNIG